MVCEVRICHLLKDVAWFTCSPILQIWMVCVANLYLCCWLQWQFLTEIDRDKRIVKLKKNKNASHIPHQGQVVLNISEQICLHKIPMQIEMQDLSQPQPTHSCHIWLIWNLQYFAGRRLKFAHQSFAICDLIKKLVFIMLN